MVGEGMDDGDEICSPLLATPTAVDGTRRQSRVLVLLPVEERRLEDGRLLYRLKQRRRDGTTRVGSEPPLRTVARGNHSRPGALV